MIEIPSELYEIESDGNTIIYRYVPHIEPAGVTNFIEEWYYDQTEIHLQEMILNIKNQIK